MTVLTWPVRLVGFFLWYLWEFLRSNFSVTWDTLTPTHLSSPHVVRCDTSCRTEFEVSLLNILISLTPGTLVLSTQERPPDGDEAPTGPPTFRIYVHTMFNDDPESARRMVAEVERRMLCVTRPFAGAGRRPRAGEQETAP